MNMDQRRYEINRRSLLRAIPGVIGAGAATAAIAVSSETPIMSLFRQWQEAHRLGNDTSLPEIETDAWGGRMSEIEKQIMETPCQTAQDVAAKVLAWTNYGDFVLDEQGGAAFWKEARALVGGAV